MKSVNVMPFRTLERPYMVNMIPATYVKVQSGINITYKDGKPIETPVFKTMVNDAEMSFIIKEESPLSVGDSVFTTSGIYEIISVSEIRKAKGNFSGIFSDIPFFQKTTVKFHSLANFINK